MAGSTQIRNSEQVNLLRADFQPRYEPNFALANAVSTIMALPGLRAFWPLSSVDYATATQARDIAGGGYHLANNNTVTFGYWAGSLIPVANFVIASSQYLSRADGGAANWADITGTETYITAGQRGLTLMAWYNPTTAATGAVQSFAGKFNTANQRAYDLRLSAAGLPAFIISTNGIATISVSSTQTATSGVWQFAACVYVPSTSITIYYNDLATTNVAAIPASLFDSTASFSIGAQSTPAAYFGGSISMVALCAAACTSAQVLNVYRQTRALFGV